MAGQSGSSPTWPQPTCTTSRTHGGRSPGCFIYVVPGRAISIARAGARACAPSVVTCHRPVISRAGRRNTGLNQLTSATAPTMISSKKATAAIAASTSKTGWCHGEPLVCAAMKPAKAPPTVATPVHHPMTPLALQGPIRLSGIPASLRAAADMPFVSQGRAHRR